MFFSARRQIYEEYCEVGSLSRGKIDLGFPLNPAKTFDGISAHAEDGNAQLIECLLAYRNSDASMVQPGVLALGKKKRRGTHWKVQS